MPIWAIPSAVMARFGGCMFPTGPSVTPTMVAV